MAVPVNVVTESIRIQKKNLRDQYSALRKIFVTSKQPQFFSLQMLRQQSWYAKAKNVAMYIPDEYEFPTKDLFEFCRRENKTVTVPTIESEKKLSFSVLHEWTEETDHNHEVTGLTLQKTIDPMQIDLFFIPLVAFDRTGKRLGRNGGYYDRLFSDPNIRGIKVGLGYEFQDTLKVPTEHHDIPMDYILTEKRIIRAL